MIDEIVEFIKDVLVYLIIIVVIVLLKVYVISIVEIVGDSMEPNYRDGNIMLMDKLVHKHIKYFNYKRFDIVVISYSNPSYLIKRIIGMPGEKLTYIENKLYIDGVIVDEKIKLNGKTDDFEGEVIIPDNMYFVMGDNREHSVDSRTFGLVSKNDILGKPFLLIWPFKEIRTVK